MTDNQNIKQKAGQKGGLATLARYGPDHRRTIGKRGAAVTWQRYSLTPYKQSQYAMVDQQMGTIKAIR